MGRGSNKDMRALVRRFRKGYRIVQKDTGHFHVIDPDGQVVRDADARPVALPNTPTFDYHYRRRIESTLRQLGVID